MSVIYAVKTTVGREEHVLERMAITIEKKAMPVRAIIMPKDIKGYILVEAENIAAIEQAIRGVNHARGVVRQEVKLDEIKHFLIAKPAKMKISVGDTIELITGPFKGEKAKVRRVNKVKREVTVELFEAAIPIPVTVAIESIRVLTHTEEAGEKEAEEEVDIKKDIGDEVFARREGKIEKAEPVEEVKPEPEPQVTAEESAPAEVPVSETAIPEEGVEKPAVAEAEHDPLEDELKEKDDEETGEKS